MSIRVIKVRATGTSIIDKGYDAYSASIYGQSNAGTLANSTYPDPDIIYLKPYNAELFDGAGGDNNGSWDTFNKQAGDGHSSITGIAYILDQKLGDKKLKLNNLAFGGTSVSDKTSPINDWNVATTARGESYLQDVTIGTVANSGRKLRRKSPTIQSRRTKDLFLGWYQGEANAKTDDSTTNFKTDTYDTLNAIVQSKINEGIDTSELIIGIYRIGPSLPVGTHPNSATVRTLQAEIVTDYFTDNPSMVGKVHSIVLIDTDSYEGIGDDIHLSKQGQINLGIWVANNIILPHINTISNVTTYGFDSRTDDVFYLLDKLSTLPADNGIRELMDTWVKSLDAAAILGHLDYINVLGLDTEVNGLFDLLGNNKVLTNIGAVHVANKNFTFSGVNGVHLKAAGWNAWDKAQKNDFMLGAYVFENDDTATSRDLLGLNSSTSIKQQPASNRIIYYPFTNVLGVYTGEIFFKDNSQYLVGRDSSTEGFLDIDGVEVHRLTANPYSGNFPVEPNGYYFGSRNQTAQFFNGKLSVAFMGNSSIDSLALFNANKTLVDGLKLI